jgi:hypothetical protein
LVHHDAGYVTIVEGAEGLSPEEEAVVASMISCSGKERRTLADIILDKIQEKEAEKRGDAMDEEEIGVNLPPKVVEVSVPYIWWRLLIDESKVSYLIASTFAGLHGYWKDLEQIYVRETTEGVQSHSVLEQLGRSVVLDTSRPVDTARHVCRDTDFRLQLEPQNGATLL